MRATRVAAVQQPGPAAASAAVPAAVAIVVALLSHACRPCPAPDTDNLPIKLPPPAARDSDEDDSSDDEIPGSRGVPGFWLQAMSNNEVRCEALPCARLL